MGGRDPLSVLVPTLWDHNIHDVAKLADNIPIDVRVMCNCSTKDACHVYCTVVCCMIIQGDKFLSPEMVYRTFIVKKFRQEEENQPTPLTVVRNDKILLIICLFITVLSGNFAGKTERKRGLYFFTRFRAV